MQGASVLQPLKNSIFLLQGTYDCHFSNLDPLIKHAFKIQKLLLNHPFDMLLFIKHEPKIDIHIVYVESALIPTALSVS